MFDAFPWGRDPFEADVRWVWARGRATLRLGTLIPAGCSHQLHAHPFGSKGNKKAGFKDARARGTVRNHPLPT